MHRSLLRISLSILHRYTAFLPSESRTVLELKQCNFDPDVRTSRDASMSGVVDFLLVDDRTLHFDFRKRLP